MEQRQPYVVELPDGRTIEGWWVIQRDGAGATRGSYLTEGRVDGEAIDDAEFERLARVHAGFQ